MTPSLRVLHVLHHSWPLSDGYGIRSDYIVRLQQRSGIEPAVLTSVQHDCERDGVEERDGIQFFRTAAGRKSGTSPLREFYLVRRLQQRLLDVARKFRPHVLHAHSPVLVGWPALAVSRHLRVPFVYEVRDFWENAAADRGRFTTGSLPYRGARAWDTYVLRRSDAIVTLGEAMRRHIRTRVGGVPPTYVVENGVDVAEFHKGAADSCREVSTHDGQTILYVGAFQPYEGLDTLIRALPLIQQEIPKARLVLVGGGEREGELRSLAATLSTGDAITFTGKVPHSQVKRYYESAALAVYPRIATRTTVLTTPLKPLEAMAMGCPVIVSDLPAMRELVEPGVTGDVFAPGDPYALARAAVTLLSDHSRSQQLSVSAARWVAAHRDWLSIIPKYRAIYESVGVRVVD